MLPTWMSDDCQLSVCLLDFQLGGIWLDPKGIVVYRIGDHGVLVVPVSRADADVLVFCRDGGVEFEEDRINGKVGTAKRDALVSKCLEQVFLYGRKG